MDRTIRVFIFCFLIVQGIRAGDSEYFVDPRDGQQYAMVKINDSVWLAENFRFRAEDSWPYENNLEYESVYGRLYTWKAAQKACPRGWHLPSDDEWKALEKSLKIPDHQLDKTDYRIPAGQKEFDRFKETFNLEMSGCRKHEDGRFLGLNWFAFFWTSTPHKKIYAWKRAFDKKEPGIGRHTFNKKNGCAVRYVRD